MDTNNDTEGQAPNPTFLIGSLAAKASFENTCPYAKTLVGWSALVDQWAIIQIRCKRWGCRHCGERKITHFGWRCEDAQPTRLVTLTVSNSLWANPREAYDGTKGKVTQLAIRLRRQFQEFEYFKVLEVTKLGWPHYHLIVRSDYIPQKTIANIWKQLTGAYIVDVRKIRHKRDVYFYVVKYLAKQKYIPWTTRRVSWSRHFFEPIDFKSGPTLDLKHVTINDEHPEYIIRKEFHPFRIEAYSRDCWLIQPGEGHSVGKPMHLAYRKKIKHSDETD